MGWFERACGRRAEELAKEEEGPRKRKEGLAHGSVFSRTLSGNHYTYFNGRWAGKKQNTTISKAEERQIRQEMAYGAYIDEAVRICRENRQAISALLGSLREPPPLTKGATGYLAELAAKEAGGKPFSYLITDGKDRYPQELIHRCRRGVFVRSKTELLIADSLYREGARFHYEKRPDLPGLKFLPDFTIYRRSGDVIYWEHCGLIDQPRYQDTWRWKLEGYSHYGIWPGLNLICTCEESGKGVDTAQIEELLHLWRLGGESGLPG